MEREGLRSWRDILVERQRESLRSRRDGMRWSLDAKYCEKAQNRVRHCLLGENRECRWWNADWRAFEDGTREVECIVCYGLDEWTKEWTEE
jgi:hypothetical protein